jgi:prepilin signal peptidase PulO-like enzyme (type II secretory pathway)
MKLKFSSNLVGFVLGLLLFAAGAYLIYPPAALLGSGMLLMAIAVFGDNPK